MSESTGRRRRRHRAAERGAAIGLTVLVSVSGGQAGAQEVGREGLSIAREVDRKTGGYEDYEARLTMVLVGRDGKERVREMEVSALASGDGERTLLVFQSPRDLVGTALLSHSHVGASDDQWLYLPSMKRVKRIAAAKQSGSFMGSEFAYEDISSQEVGNFTYDYEGESRIVDTEVYVVERFPVDESSGYSRQRVYVDRSDYLPLRIEYFNTRGEHLKTLTLTDYEQQGPYWRARTMTMQNHQTEAFTRLEWSDFRFDVGLNERRFTADGLGRRGG
jgi:outer membrane lipoprotein-sorting protein